MFRTSTSTVAGPLPAATLAFSTPTITPESLPGWLAAPGLSTTSTRSPRIWPTILAKVGLPVRLIAKLESVREIGSRRVVADRGDASAVEVFQDHALQQVVDVLLGEGEIDAGIVRRLRHFD